MKTIISITGGLGSVSVLQGAIKGNYSIKKLSYNNTELVFNTLKEAKKALYDAYNLLIESDTGCDSINYKFGILYYDSGIAKII